MNNKLQKSIIDLEKESYAIRKFNNNKNKRKKFISLINNLFMRIVSFSRLPRYFVSKKNISDVIQEARKNIDIKIEFSRGQLKYNIEVNKVLTRINLRYKYSQQAVLANLVHQIIEENKYPINFSQYKWVSLLYPIIHTPNDKSEEGFIHQDYTNTGLKGSKIVWLPFTNYDYPGIIRTNNLLGLIAHFAPSRLGFQILKNAKEYHIKKKHKAGHWLAWNDTFYHKGILNYTNMTSIALIVRFSNKFDIETFLPLQALLSQKKGIFLSESEERHDQLVNDSISIVKNILKSASNLLEGPSLFSIIINFINKNRELGSNYSDKEIICIFHIIEYALTLFLQRIKNDSIEWLNKDKSINQILINISDAKNILMKEKSLLFKKL